MPREPRTRPGWLRATWEDFSQMIRLEAADANGYCECVTCGFKALWNSGEIHAGHFLAARYPNSAVKFDERNVHPQCKNCNTDGRVAWYRPHASKKCEAVTTRYFTYMIRRYGLAEVERLEKLRRTSAPKTEDELRVMRAEYKRRAKVAREQKGL